MDNNAVVAPHTEMEEVEVPALRDPGAEDGAPSFGSPASAMLVDDTGGMPHLENETQTTDAADTSADSRPSAETARKGQLFWDVGEVLQRRKLDYALEVLDRTAHSVCTVPDQPMEECMVCLEDMVDGHIVSSLPCQHTFHHECIAAWLRCKLQSGAPGKCPNCNFQIVVPVAQIPSPPTAVRADVYIPGPSPYDPVTCCGFEMRRNQRLLLVSILFSILVFGTLILAYVYKH